MLPTHRICIVFALLVATRTLALAPEPGKHQHTSKVTPKNPYTNYRPTSSSAPVEVPGGPAATASPATPDPHNQHVAESHLTAQLLAIIEHYKQPDPVGLPGAPIPDPFPVPNVKNSVGMGTLTMKNTLAYGMSRFRLKTIHSDMNAMQVRTSILLDEMTVRGNYTLRSLFSTADGPFTVLLKKVFVQGNASLGVERDGRIRTQDVRMDISFADMAMDFQNLGFMGSIFQSFVNSAPTLVFDTIKPFMLKEAYEKIRTEIDTNIDRLMGDQSLPNSITPLDMAIAEARRRVRQMGYDPYRVRNYNHTAGIFAVEMSGTWVEGLSSFYRVGDVAVAVENNTVSVVLQLGTQRLTGSSQWQVSVASGEWDERLQGCVKKWSMKLVILE